jgi:RNA polymerase sigma factor (sigma-70 family)
MVDFPSDERDRHEANAPPASPPGGETSRDRTDDAEPAILAAVASGRIADAIRIAMQHYGDAVYRYCRQMVKDASRADDVHQQVFIEAYRDLRTFAGRSSVRSWLFGIARHRCLDAVKGDRRYVDRYKRDAPGDTPDPARPPDTAIDDARLIAALTACLEQLAPAVRTAVLLRFQQGFSFEEMSRMSDERAGTLQQRVARALPVLRECIESRTGGTL